MPHVAEHLVGRAVELTAADALLAGLAKGEPAALLLAGEPGIGKTRLLAELAAHADAQGCLVLSGSASELESDLPFWLFVDALDEYVAGLDPRRLAALADDVQADLAHVLPALSERGRGVAGADADERYRAHGAVRALLERMATGAPLVLVLDDVHWADAASADLIAALLRRPPAAPMLMAMATRPRQAPERLSRALERAHRHEALTRLDLGGLARAEAAQLLGDGVDAARADALYAETGGNPFYLEQLARSPGSTGREDAALLGGAEVPPAVVASLREELTLLPAPTRKVLEGAAVAGDPFEPELAAAAAALDEPAATGPLDDLLALGLVRATEVPRRFRFRHPLVRRAVYESAPPAWRLGAHERCAAALAARGAPPAARAHHVEHAARRGDLAAVAVLAQAADSALRRAPASAATWLAAALRLLPEAVPPEQRAHLLISRATALAGTGPLTDARADLLAALELVPPEAVTWWVGLTVACAGIEHRLGLHAEARGRLADALHRLPDRESPEAAELMIQLGIADLFRTRFDSMRAWGARAERIARPLGDRPLAAAAAALLALGAALAGGGRTADDACNQAAALVAALPDEELGHHPGSAAYLALAHQFLDSYGAAVAAADRALAIERATGHGPPTLARRLGLAWIMLGRLVEAERLLDGEIERLRVDGVAQGLGLNLAHRALGALAAGDHNTALAAAHEAVALARDLDAPFISAWTAVSLAAALAAAGDPGGAETALVPEGGEDVPPLPGGWPVMALELLTRCRLATGRADDARRAVAGAEVVAARVRLPMADSWAARAAAATLLADGDAVGAAELARASTAAAERAHAPVEAATARMLAARAMAAAGGSDAAAAELEAAADAFEACGAVRRREAAEQELRRLGRRVHRRARPGSGDAGGLESLTGRELEVVDLVVDRRTNPEIAAELFLSLKTVETHLRNVFRKLGVSSRVELARTVERARRSG
jgi:DNA-binding NarL/FixJ family response regulator/tetratricopeptide (TPR) repeat protein